MTIKSNNTTNAMIAAKSIYLAKWYSDNKVMDIEEVLDYVEESFTTAKISPVVKINKREGKIEWAVLSVIIESNSSRKHILEV